MTQTRFGIQHSLSSSINQQKKDCKSNKNDEHVSVTSVVEFCRREATGSRF